MRIINGKIVCEVHTRSVPPKYHPAFAQYIHESGYSDFLCQKALDIWLDSADIDPGMEPARLVFL